MFPRTVVKQDLSKLLDLFESRALGRIGIVNVVLHIAVTCDQHLVRSSQPSPILLTQEGRGPHGSSSDTVSSTLPQVVDGIWVYSRWRYILT